MQHIEAQITAAHGILGGMPTSSTSPREREILPQLSNATIVRWFKIVAIAEAISWALLLTGMYFKYLATDRTDVLVSIFGALHGGIFVLFVALTLLVWRRLRWSFGTLALALVSAVPPFFTIPFEMWASRTGRLDPTRR
ncbi:DUF3817 domain-containing protein [Epidermidibacterium keratini]|nr:DUF3817 domain-containing protein [Epidermidibacterium keratini]